MSGENVINPVSTPNPEPEAEGASDVPFIVSTEELRELLARFESQERPRCAIDTEADSLHSYQEKLCLIQFNCDGQDAIIDPLVIDDLTPLVEFLETADVWMHGSDFDMSMFRRTFNRIPPTVLDTQIAARLVGFRQFGLARMVEEIVGIKLSKGSQRANWGKRPLTDKMMLYAVNDVRYVIEIADRLLADLDRLGRRAWFEESCEVGRENVLNRQPADPDEVWRVTGWGKLKPKGLAFLRGAWRWRDAESQRMDRPPFKVITNETILDLAERFHAGEKVALPDRYSAPQQRRFQRVVKEVSSMSRDEWPKGRMRVRVNKPPNTDARLSELRKRRDAVAEDLDIDPTLIAPKAILEALAASEDGLAAEQLMQWQRELMGLT